MSDSFQDLEKHYEQNVFIGPHSRSIGLFPIPEYPELEPERGMWSAALGAILTTLRYLAPATLLTLFWGQQSFLFKLLKHIDSAFRAIVFSSEEQKQTVLKWLADVGPVRVESLDTVWRHGWIVCGVLDGALPGACAGHPPTRLSIKHAQAIADHYLGVEPVFSRQELDSNDALSKHQEWKLATYLDRIRLSLAKLPPPVSKPGSQRTSPETTQFTLDYVAKGSGLTAAQVYQKMSFKIYPTSQQSLDPGEITILIRGPKDTYGMTVLPPILGKAQLIRQKLLGLESKANYTENILPITQGATYLRSYGKTDMNKTYYIPKTKYDIEIETDSRADHTKISYIASIEGRYEISITSRGQNIVGSPFSLSASHNILSCLERDSFYLEDGEEIDIVDVKTDRKVVLRIVDFVTEKMLLKENGSLEKITDDEAKILMTTENSDDDTANEGDEIITYESFLMNEAPVTKKNEKFNKIAKKVIMINRVCNVFNDIIVDMKNDSNKESKCLLPRSQQDIPDIVNSTFTETNINPFMLVDVRDKYIIPENISVSLKTIKTLDKTIMNESTSETISECDKYENIEDIFTEQALQNPSGLFTFEDDQEDDILMVITSSPSNPFLADTYADSFVREKDLGAFVTSEYETNNCQNEETDELTKIILDENIAPSPNNPFIVELERPKTPVYKIITGDIKNREDSVYVKTKNELLTDEMLSNEFINPFFIHQHLQTGRIEEPLPTTDFIIGAPVSLHPVIRAASPKPNRSSLIITTDNENIVAETLYLTGQGEQVKIIPEESKSEFSTPLHTNLTLTRKVDNNSASSSTFHSLDSENIEILSLHTPNNQLDPYQIDVTTANRNITPKKDMWDSAYVSIDENNSSPDSNNNDNTQLCESFNKQKFSPSDDTFGLKRAELINMGPAERELWQTCNELKDDVHQTSEETRSYKWEIRRPMFTPIIEENDRSISSSVKETSLSKVGEADQVTVAFAELNDIYYDYFPNSETESTTTHDDSKQSLEVDNTIEANDVDSASEKETDVKRQTKELEGKISEVQVNATESNSVSQSLPYPEEDIIENMKIHNSGERQFGDNDRTNIVLEKKKYWDDRIRQIQAKSLESTTHQKKRRLSSKHLRHNDSLTKRRGKQIIKNFLSAGDLNETGTKAPDIMYCEAPIKSFHSLQETRSDLKLVDKWKMYWDNKLDTQKSELETTCCRVKSPKKNMYDDLDQYTKDITLESKNADNKTKSSTLPAKQELPEEVFKAFETSPKRFFGTSRKQILNKIDTFLGKPQIIDESSKDVRDTTHDSGLVSSRISLFHSISNTEELPRTRRKCQSLHNIYQRKDSEKNSDSSSIENKLNEIAKNKTQNVTESKDDIDSSVEEQNSDQESKILKQKRTQIIHNSYNKSFDETKVYQKQNTEKVPTENDNVKKATFKSSSKQNQLINKYKKTTELRKKSFSRSEMDIFNKAAIQPEDDGLDKHKSCEDLPKISVKNFITLFEGVSKTSVDSKSIGKINKMSSEPRKWHADNSNSGAVNKPGPVIHTKLPPIHHFDTIDSTSSKKISTNKSVENINTSYAKSIPDSIDIEIISNQDIETTEHLSLSDIELEIIEFSSDKSPVPDTTPHRDPDSIDSSTDYKSRFKTAKEFFQSLEELRETKKPRKMNECELLLMNKSTESTESQDSDRPQRRVKRNIKSHSMPSTEISKIWNQLQEEGETSACKLVKISEKFNVDDLFNDVMEGKLSRQGSLRGIPHKKAVLETFKSMENVADNVSPYEIAVTQLKDFVEDNQIKNAQSYLSEYPYLPTTDPSKYQSRLDVKATGLISLKELISKKPRRNSVPDIRLNPTFTVDL